MKTIIKANYYLKGEKKPYKSVTEMTFYTKKEAKKWLSDFKKFEKNFGWSSKTYNNKETLVSESTSIIVIRKIWAEKKYNKNQKS